MMEQIILCYIHLTCSMVQNQQFPDCSDSILYGMTYYGGINDLGSIFRMKLDGSDFKIYILFLMIRQMVIIHSVR